MATTRKKTTTTSATTGKGASPRTATRTAAAKAAEALADEAATLSPVQGVTQSIPEAGEGGKFAKKDIIDRVIARSGVKPRFVRDVADALLAELGEMAETADTIQAQPMGNLKIQRRRDLEDGEIIILKLRRKSRGQDDDEALAAAAE